MYLGTNFCYKNLPFVNININSNNFFILVGDPDLYQGDMRLTSFQRLLVLTGGDVSLARRNGLTFGSAKDENLQWPKRVVPYEISADLGEPRELDLVVTNVA